MKIYRTEQGLSEVWRAQRVSLELIICLYELCNVVMLFFT